MCEDLFGNYHGSVDYYAQYTGKHQIQRRAYQYSPACLTEAMEAFNNGHFGWIYDHALYTALKRAHGMKSFREWPHTRTKNPGQKKLLSIQRVRDISALTEPSTSTIVAYGA